MRLKEEIQKQKELLYLNSLKVANQTLTEAESEGLEVSSGLLSSSASLLKLKLDDVLVADKDSNDMKDLLSSLISQDSKAMDSESTTKIKSPHYKES
jgi:hypothetical protein